MTANARARALLATALEVQETEIEPSATINNTALWNSLTHADLIVAADGVNSATRNRLAYRRRLSKRS